MPRLIDANEIVKLDHQHYDYWSDEFYVTVRDIENAQTVDAEPVRHGHWVKSEDADDGYCSVCKCDMPMYREDWEWKYSETPYCPNCGAKMDERKEG